MTGLFSRLASRPLRVWGAALPVLALAVMLCRPHGLQAAELVTLSPENYQQYVPQGKEVDAIFGDWVMRNDQIVVVIADAGTYPTRGRSASRAWGPEPQGRIIDLTTREAGNDLLGQFDVAYRMMPQGMLRGAQTHQNLFIGVDQLHQRPERQPVTGPRVQLRLPFEASHEVTYTLEDGWPYVLVELKLVNGGSKPLRVQPGHFCRLNMGPAGPDQPFLFGEDRIRKLSWAYDPWFGQAYGSLRAGDLPADGPPVDLAPGQSLLIRSRLFPARDLLGVRSIANRLTETPQRSVRLEVTDRDGPVAGADVRVYQTQAAEVPPGAVGSLPAGIHAMNTGSVGKPSAAPEGEFYGAGRTDEQGVVEMDLPAGPYEVRIAAAGRTETTLSLDARETPLRKVILEPAGYVAAEIRGEDGQGLPAKVEFRGRGNTPDPFFFPDTGEHLVRNLVYTHTGRFRQPLPPGEYQVVVTHGPEYDAFFQDLTIIRGQTTPLQVTLRQVVDTTGWISADFGNRSTISRPFTTASTLGRVLNLIAEHIEFAPATERDFIATYEPQIRQLNAEGLLATAPGIGLVQRRKGHSDYNVFPVRHVPGDQDGGAPQRPQHVLMLFWLHGWYGPEFLTSHAWTAGTEKLIQVQPPQVYPSDGRWDGMYWYFEDRHHNLERVLRDGRFAELPHMHAMELQPLEAFLRLPPFDPADPKGLADIEAWWDELIAREADNAPNVPDRNLEWMRMLNLGYRFTGVVNSNAYANFHGSGGYRTYIHSPTDQPDEIDPLAVVRAVQAGHTVMTTGPFVEVQLRGQTQGIPGDDVVAPDGAAALHVRVQSSNWCRVDRVRVLYNGRPVPELTFTRIADPERFTDSVVAFDQTLPLALEHDTHIVVLADGQGPNLRAGGEGKEDTVTHVAMTNPIWVDVHGDGFHPTPPFVDQVYTRFEHLTPLSSEPAAGPARVRLIMKNLGSEPARDTLSLRIYPEGAARVVGENRFPYTLAPGATQTVAFEIALTEGWSSAFAADQPAVVRVHAPRSSHGVGRRTAALSLKVDAPPTETAATYWLPEQVPLRPSGR